MRSNDILKFAYRLNDKMTEKKITGKKLAELIGIKEYSMSYIRNGKNFPSVKHLIDICEVLDTTPDFLLGFDKEEK